MKWPWARGPLLGVLTGLPILGIGGRLCMRAIAVSTGVPGAFTLEGTLTVVGAGAGSGLVAGALYAILARLLARRRWHRDLVFVLLMAWLTARGLHPIRPLPLALFGSLMALFVVAFLAAWHRGVLAVDAGKPLAEETLSLTAPSGGGAA
jgi:hypothetical protein